MFHDVPETEDLSLLNSFVSYYTHILPDILKCLTERDVSRLARTCSNFRNYFTCLADPRNQTESAQWFRKIFPGMTHCLQQQQINNFVRNRWPPTRDELLANLRHAKEQLCALVPDIRQLMQQMEAASGRNRVARYFWAESARNSCFNTFYLVSVPICGVARVISSISLIVTIASTVFLFILLPFRGNKTGSDILGVTAGILVISMCLAFFSIFFMLPQVIMKCFDRRRSVIPPSAYPEHLVQHMYQEHIRAYNTLARQYSLPSLNSHADVNAVLETLKTALKNNIPAPGNQLYRSITNAIKFITQLNTQLSAFQRINIHRGRYPIENGPHLPNQPSITWLITQVHQLIQNVDDYLRTIPAGLPSEVHIEILDTEETTLLPHR